MTTPGENVVDILGLSHRYGSRLALDQLSLNIQRGEIFGFLGPNGSGKTTLFRVLSTLIPPQEGSARLLGFDLSTQRDAIRRKIGVVFQSPSLDKQLTAHENLVHHGHLYGMSGALLASRIAELLEKFDLRDRAGELVQTFSGGMRRRVELAKGLLNRPSLLLLDEPSTGLDPGARIDLWQQLSRLQAAEGMTILFTTHLMDEGERCTRLAIMSAGRLVACDTPANLKARIGGDVITLQTPDAPKAKQILLEKLNIQAERLENVLRFERANAHQFVPAIIEALPGLVDSISVGRPTLEDVFISVTGRTFRTPTQS